MQVRGSWLQRYTTSAGAVPKGNHRHRKDRFSTMLMHVDVTLFPIKIILDDHLIHMADIMLSIMRSQSP